MTVTISGVGTIPLASLGAGNTYSGSVYYGMTYAHLLTACNESGGTDGFLVTGVFNGRAFYNTGSLASPVMVEFSSWVDSTAGLVVRLTGIFLSGVKLSGTDTRLYWLPDTPSWPHIKTFVVRAYDQETGVYGDGDDTVSAGTADIYYASNVPNRLFFGGNF